MARRLARFSAPALLFLLTITGAHAQTVNAPVSGQPIGGGASPIMLVNPVLNNARVNLGPGVGAMKSDLPAMGKTPGVTLTPGVGFTKGVGVMPTLPQTLVPLSEAGPLQGMGMPQFEEYSIKPAPAETAGNRKDLPPNAAPNDVSKALAVKTEALRKPIQNAADLSGATGEAAAGLGRKVIDVLMDGAGNSRTENNLKPLASVLGSRGTITEKEGRLGAAAARAGEESPEAAIPSVIDGSYRTAYVYEEAEAYQGGRSRRKTVARGNVAVLEAQNDPITLAGGVALIVMQVSQGRLSLSHVAPLTPASNGYAAEGYFGGNTGTSAGSAAVSSRREDYAAMTLQAFRRAGRGADSAVGRALVEDLTLEALPAAKTRPAAPKAAFRASRTPAPAEKGLSLSAKFGLPLLLWPFFPLFSLAFKRPD